MENKKQNSITRTWAWTGLILILLAVGYSFFKPQTPSQEFVYGVLVGMVIVYFVAFIYQAGKEHLGKRQ